MSPLPYQENPELMAMKEDIADRKFRVKMIGLAVVGTLLAGAAAAAFFVPASAGAVLAVSAKLLLPAGAALASIITLKEVKRLEMDEKYLQSYMQGKNYWGEGYREEVADHGYSLGSPFPGAAPPPLDQDRGR